MLYLFQTASQLIQFHHDNGRETEQGLELLWSFFYGVLFLAVNDELFVAGVAHLSIGEGGDRLHFK